MDKVFAVVGLKYAEGNKSFEPLTDSSIMYMSTSYENAKNYKNEKTYSLNVRGEFMDGPLIIKEMSVNENGMIEI